jgi:hypothetical protein
VLEAVKPVVRIVPLSNLLPAYWVHLPIKWTPAVEEFALSLVGRAEYSEIEAVRAFFGINSDSEAWECAELVRAIYERCGIDMHGRDTPTEVVLAAQKMGGGVVLLEKLA